MDATRNKCHASSNKCIATSNKCLTSSNKKLLEASASLLVTICLLFSADSVVGLVGPNVLHQERETRNGEGTKEEKV